MQPKHFILFGFDLKALLVCSMCVSSFNFHLEIGPNIHLVQLQIDFSYYRHKNLVEMNLAISEYVSS